MKRAHGCADDGGDRVVVLGVVDGANQRLFRVFGVVLADPVRVALTNAGSARLRRL